MRLIQDSEHKLHMLQTDTADAKQRSKRLQDQCGLSIQKWQTLVSETQQQIKKDHQLTVEKNQKELVESYLTQIQQKNQELAKLEARRLQIHSQMLAEPDEQQTLSLQSELEQVVGEFKSTVEHRVEMVRQMILELESLFKRHEQIQNCHMDT